MSHSTIPTTPDSDFLFYTIALEGRFKSDAKRVTAVKMRSARPLTDAIFDALQGACHVHGQNMILSTVLSRAQIQNLTKRHKLCNGKMERFSISVV